MVRYVTIPRQSTTLALYNGITHLVHGREFLGQFDLVVGVGVQHGLGMFDPDLGALSENSFVLNFPFGLDHLTSQVVQVLFVSVVEMIEFLRLFEAFLAFAHDFLGGQLELQGLDRALQTAKPRDQHFVVFVHSLHVRPAARLVRRNRLLLKDRWWRIIVGAPRILL